MKKGKKGKKKTKEEIEEEERLEQERLREIERLAEIERRKFAIVKLPTGVEQVITNYCIENVWNHQKPKDYLRQFFIRQLKTMNIIGNFQLIDLDIITEYTLYNIIFAKDKLKLDDEKTVILTNLLFSVLRNNDKRFSQKSKDLGPQEIEAEEYLASIYNKEVDDFKEANSSLQLREKTCRTDMDHFIDLVRRHCFDNPPSAQLYFTPEQAKEIITYQKDTYFKHFNLYKYCSDEKQQEKSMVEQIMIDEPQAMEPLITFEEIVKEKSEEKLSEEVEEKKEDEIEKDKQQEEVLEQEQDDYDKLDPEIRKMIDTKIQETEEIMKREVSERKKYLDEKLDDILNPKKDQKKGKKK